MESTGLKPKLCTGFALEAFFRHFETHAEEGRKHFNGEHIVRAMAISKNFAQIGKKRSVGKRLWLTQRQANSSWQCRFSNINGNWLTESEAVLVFATAKPTINSLILTVQSSSTPIDKNLVDCLVGIPNLTIKSSDNHTIWLPLLQKMAPHLKNLQCPMECFGYNWPPMKLDAYINNFYSRKDKIGLSTLCSSVHEIRRIVLRIREDNDEERMMNNSLSVNPTVEDAILEYRTDWRPSNLFGYSPPHLLKRLPNLRRVFYFMRINYHNGLSIQLTSLNTFVQEWLKELPNCKLIVNVQIHLSRDIVREDVLAEVRHSEFLHGQELSLVSNEELNNDPDLMLRSGYEMDNEIMVWTGERTKFFVWRRRQF